MLRGEAVAKTNSVLTRQAISVRASTEGNARGGIDKQQHQFGDLIAVDAIVAQQVAENPEFLGNVVIDHGYFPAAI
ncbi:hypothetical protein [Chitinilyticum litopenaei]|uniref:hypothetical protein n=1 Tax=Chitinilyticum litopenaei TaxID=1121276 RepID=UPI00130D68A6|nr:hypothetical protein [Chitinilyticum litopenaei]